MSKKHLAAILTSPGSPLTVAERDTPGPGSNEVLIQVKVVALNPVDYYQRDYGRPPTPVLPAVLGSDSAGIIAEVGSGVSNTLRPGTRVLAFASSFYQDGHPDYGSCQQFVLAREDGVIPLPASFSFEQGAVLPLATLTALSAYTTIGLPLTTTFSPEQRQAILIWGGSSSVGSLAVQSAKQLGYTVYATAGASNLEYVKELGADSVFDYKSSNVVQSIIEKSEADHVHLHTAHVIVDDALEPTLAVLEKTKGDGVAHIAHAPLLPPEVPTRENIKIAFTFPPTDAEERNVHIRDCFHHWLQEKIASGAVVASPRIQSMPGGLGGINYALDALKQGVSGTKIVVSI